MDKRTFSMQVEIGLPLIIITPYGTSIHEMINIILISLVRSGLRNIYTERQYETDDDLDIPIYQNGPGIIVMTSVLDNIPYNNMITPIYIVEWGIRSHNINSYLQWIAPIQPLILFPSFLPNHQSPTIKLHSCPLTHRHYQISLIDPIALNLLYPDHVQNLQDKNVTYGGWIDDNVITNIIIYSPKIASLITEIDPLIQSVIYSSYVHQYGLNFIHEMVKNLGVPIYMYYSDDDTRNLQIFLNQRTGILLTNDSSILNSMAPHVSIHIINLDSSQCLNLIASHHHHNIIHFYIATGPHNESTYDTDQYRLFVLAVHDCNKNYQTLVANSIPITIDNYNNLYINLK